MTLAIPASLKPLLDRSAERNRRSLTKQIIVMLEAAIAAENVPVAEQASQA